jgi:Rv0078B-related antitoxin
VHFSAASSAGRLNTCYDASMPPPLDTTPEIEAMQIRIFRSMTVERHLEIALEISLLSRALMRAGVRRDHPDWSDKEIEREVHRLAFFPQPLPDWVG